jgi:hypothetical protein
MKRVFLLIAVSALLVTLGFAQTPDVSSNTDQTNVKGCLGGSEGNYTIAEEGTRHIFNITSSSVDLKPHLGHDVQLTGHKAAGTVSAGPADNSFAVTELNMISEHCGAAAAAPAATASPTPATVTPPPADATAPAATVSPASTTVTPPAVDAAAPAAPVSPASTTVIPPAVDTTVPATPVSPASTTVTPPAVDATVPAATVSPTSATVITDAANDARPTRVPSHHRRPSATQAAATSPDATVIPSSEAVSTPAAAAASPAATATPSAEAASTPTATTTPAPTVTHKGGSLSLLISFVVLVIALATLTPFFFRWRKRKMLERTDTPNLSFSNEVISDPDKPEEPRKAA